MDKLNNYYITFGQQSPLRDGFITISAPDEETARAEAVELFSLKWSMIYTEKTMDFASFPEGQFGKAITIPYSIKERDKPDTEYKCLVCNKPVEIGIDSYHGSKSGGYTHQDCTKEK